MGKLMFEHLLTHLSSSAHTPADFREKPQVGSVGVAEGVLVIHHLRKRCDTPSLTLLEMKGICREQEHLHKF